MTPAVVVSECEKLGDSEGKKSTFLVVREAELRSTAEFLCYLDEDSDRAQAHEHFGIPFDVQLIWCSIK